MTDVLLAELRKLPDEILALNDLPEPLPERLRIEMTICRALEIVDRHVDLVYHETAPVPVLEHEGPDIQYEHVIVTDEIKDIHKHYWEMVSTNG
jgi:hypothetical protein